MIRNRESDEDEIPCDVAGFIKKFQTRCLGPVTTGLEHLLSRIMYIMFPKSKSFTVFYHV